MCEFVWGGGFFRGFKIYAAASLIGAAENLKTFQVSLGLTKFVKRMLETSQPLTQFYLKG